MMKIKILTFVFSLGFLAIFVHGDPSALLDNMAASGKTINGFLRPVMRGFIDRGAYGFLFRGEVVYNNRLVAMKFVKKEFKNTTDREFEIYSYLDAVDNPKVEKYGISSVYYYNEWAGSGYMVMAFSYFYGGNLELQHPIEEPIDTLILFKQFILQAKYMHSKGVRHDDIKPENIMLRRGRSYLIDFNYSSKMGEFSGGGTLNFASRCYHRGETRCAMDDLESFLYTQCYLNSVELQWFSTTEYADPNDSDVINECGDLKEDTAHIFSEIENIESTPLRNVFEAFAQEVFNNYSRRYPNYDYLDKVITANIRNLTRSSNVPLFSWLTNQEIQDANQDPPLADIQNDIENPSKIRKFKYIQPDYTYFYQLKKLKSFGSSSGSSSSSIKRQKSFK